jgi:hypothetical protein
VTATTSWGQARGSPGWIHSGAELFGEITERPAAAVIEDDDRHDTVATNLAPHALPGGYPNLLGPTDDEQIAHAFGANTNRLRAAKNHFDPNGVFSAIPLPA